MHYLWDMSPFETHYKRRTVILVTPMGVGVLRKVSLVAVYPFLGMFVGMLVFGSCGT